MEKSNERIYVLGATGNVGSVVLDKLIKSGIQVTAYTRTPPKVANTSSTITIIQGGYHDLTPFNESIAGHTRLFLLVPDMDDMAAIKIALAKKAYEAGVKQIVDLSVQSVPWRQYQALLPHQVAEKAIYELANKPSRNHGFVSLRPSNFMSNLLFNLETIQKQSTIMDSASAPDELQEWISPCDIGEVAARILMDPVEKHGDAAYELVGDVKTPQERAQFLSELLDRTITYTQVPPQTMYDTFLKMGSASDLAYCAATYRAVSPAVTRGLPILLGRQPESIQKWMARNKSAFS
ncbi:hypothetical protein BDB00DRAFT_823082 [Zychaea mexicana]|uniref:uncharacterized protein n=1 Tax=Zychaea mexicana TaxID=64656 RepID=UPI0022FE9039|nr:uncharacterized protein BDB00DRAFT_823082 [Zychaea mexicana]KAI9493435.1 hypothetical protein BDB00DRAFT_823082 [Zychaea mexicana]